jgi:phosphoribosyl-ATP pyrophosphohydrolase
MRISAGSSFKAIAGFLRAGLDPAADNRPIRPCGEDDGCRLKAGTTRRMTPATFTLDDLACLVAERASASPEESYTAKLLADGPARAAKKLGEEAVEAAIAAVQGDRKALVAEAADVLYHLLVVLKAGDVPLGDVMAELERRTAQSGLAEKESRGQPLAREP